VFGGCKCHISAKRNLEIEANTVVRECILYVTVWSYIFNILFRGRGASTATHLFMASVVAFLSTNDMICDLQRVFVSLVERF